MKWSLNCTRTVRKFFLFVLVVLFLRFYVIEIPGVTLPGFPGGKRLSLQAKIFV